tara:strand:+ start:12889 stop:13209 length:321 start_codon:yes stop_codon:yes gene_type:complete
MDGLRFKKTGAPIQVAGIKASDAKITVANTGLQFDANKDRVVEIQDYSGAGVWFAIKSTNDIVNPSAANGNLFIPPYGITRPFLLKKAMYIEASGTVNIRALDTQE